MGFPKICPLQPLKAAILITTCCMLQHVVMRTLYKCILYCSIQYVLMRILSDCVLYCTIQYVVMSILSNCILFCSIQYVVAFISFRSIACYGDTMTYRSRDSLVIHPLKLKTQTGFFTTCKGHNRTLCVRYLEIRVHANSLPFFFEDWTQSVRYQRHYFTHEAG